MHKEQTTWQGSTIIFILLLLLLFLFLICTHILFIVYHDLFILTNFCMWKLFLFPCIFLFWTLFSLHHGAICTFPLFLMIFDIQIFLDGGESTPLQDQLIYVNAINSASLIINFEVQVMSNWTWLLMAAACSSISLLRSSGKWAHLTAH